MKERWQSRGTQHSVKNVLCRDMVVEGVGVMWESMATVDKEQGITQ